MRIQAIMCGVPSHDYSMSFMLDVLRARGHEIVYTGFFRQKDLPEVMSDGVDCTVSSLNQPFNSRHEDFRDPARPWVLFSHGISLHKPFSMGRLGIDFSFYHMPVWLDYLRAFHDDTCTPICTHGWGKLDQYWKLTRECRGEVKEEVYKQHGLDPGLPLIVYAPSWSREGYETWAKWQDSPHHNDIYVCAGTEYMSDRVLAKLNTIRANLVYLPHDMREDSEDGEGFWPSRRVELLAAADLLVSDTSSMAAEFLMMDKPIVQIARMPEDRLDGHLHLFHTPELPPCHLGDPVYDLDTLVDIVERRLVTDEYAAVRDFWLRHAVGRPDGLCAEREAVALESCVDVYTSEPWPHEPGTVEEPA